MGAVGRDEERARRSREERDDVDADEAPAPEQLLEGPAEPPEHEHVEEEVDRARVEEAGGDEPPPFAVGDERPEEGAALEDLARRPPDVARLGDLRRDRRRRSARSAPS